MVQTRGKFRNRYSSKFVHQVMLDENIFYLKLKFDLVTIYSKIRLQLFNLRIKTCSIHFFIKLFLNIGKMTLTVALDRRRSCGTDKIKGLQLITSMAVGHSDCHTSAGGKRKQLYQLQSILWGEGQVPSDFLSITYFRSVQLISSVLILGRSMFLRSRFRKMFSQNFYRIAKLNFKVGLLIFCESIEEF